MNYSLDNLIKAIEELYTYRNQRTLYECECAVREKNAQLRQVSYTASAEKQRKTTVELSRCKLKATLLKQTINNDADYQKIFQPLLDLLDERIEYYRALRRQQSRSMLTQ